MRGDTEKRKRIPKAGDTPGGRINHSKVRSHGLGSFEHSEAPDEASIMNKSKSGKGERKRKKDKPMLKKKRKFMETQSEAEAVKVDQTGYENEDCSKGLKSERKARDGHARDSVHTEIHGKENNLPDPIGESNGTNIVRKNKSAKVGKRKKKDRLVMKKKSKLMERGSEVDVDKVDQIPSVDEYCSRGMKTDGNAYDGDARDLMQSEIESKENDLLEPMGESYGTDIVIKNKFSKGGKKGKKDSSLMKQKWKSMEKESEFGVNKVDQISLIDEDCSRGMKKWLIEYHCRRPRLEILQQRIDDFIIAHEAQEEQEREEREAHAAEGGWTVVGHHKGRKKTIDIESGIAVGSVAQAAVMGKLAKKKSKEVALDFYRFQRREAHRNELMQLQSKFEQDKMRIQQMRAARKFRPY